MENRYGGTFNIFYRSRDLFADRGAPEAEAFARRGKLDVELLGIWYEQ